MSPVDEPAYRSEKNHTGLRSSGQAHQGDEAACEARRLSWYRYIELVSSASVWPPSPPWGMKGRLPMRGRPQLLPSSTHGAYETM